MLISSSAVLWFFITLAMAWLQSWRIWWALIGLMLIASLSSLAIDIDALDMLFGMSMYFLPAAAVLGVAMWFSQFVAAHLRHKRDNK